MKGQLRLKKNIIQMRKKNQEKVHEISSLFIKFI